MASDTPHDPPSPSTPAPSPAEITLGILAGGAATRLGGADKAWLERDGVPQVLRRVHEAGRDVGVVLVSANRSLEKYAAAGLRALPDEGRVGSGPMSGLHVLASACSTPWLLTVPVDLVELPAGFMGRLAARVAGNGCFAVDDDGPQPLVAVWHAQALRDGTRSALRDGRYGVLAMQRDMGLAFVAFEGVRFGNLNHPADLASAGMHASGQATSFSPSS